MIVSIKSKNVEDYWCEGVFELKKEGNVLHGFGPCSDENHDNDIYVKKNKNDVFVKSKSFIIKDWLELKKQ